MVDDVSGKKMVVGFMFRGETVLLVTKLSPSWQHGYLNGVGGVVDDYETPVQAMVREFREETGYETVDEDWTHYVTEIEPFGAYVYFFHARQRDRFFAWPSVNDAGEPLRVVNVDDLLRNHTSAIGNLRWLVPMALDPRGFLRPVAVETSGDIRETPSW